MNYGLCPLTYSFWTARRTRYVLDGWCRWSALLINRIGTILEMANVSVGVEVENPVFTCRSLIAFVTALFTICGERGYQVCSIANKKWENDKLLLILRGFSLHNLHHVVVLVAMRCWKLDLIRDFNCDIFRGLDVYIFWNSGLLETTQWKWNIETTRRKCNEMEPSILTSLRAARFPPAASWNGGEVGSGTTYIYGW